MSASHLLIIGDREALAWVLQNERMAFQAHRRGLVAALSQGDELFIYSTRGAFHNPGRDRGRVIGVARAATAPEVLPEPIELAGRRFELGCRLELVSLAPLGSGVELSLLVERMSVFPDKRAWSGRMRRPLLQLPAQDAAVVRRLLKPIAESPAAVLDGYLAAARPAPV